MDTFPGFSEAMLLFVVLSAIPLISGLVVGLIVSIFQAATQIQEQTLTFVPKLVTVLVALFVAAPWMVRELVEYFSGVLNSIPDLRI